MTLNYRYTIVYVADVAATLAWFTEAFGLTVRMLHESGAYGELETGSTLLAFAAESLGDLNFPGGYAKHRPDQIPLGTELAFTTEDVPAAVRAAVEAGGTELAAPVEKPWGQVVAYVRDPNGILIELATPMG